jgi:hypothetical protein
MKKNIIQEKSFHFSLQIIELYKMLLEIREFVISRQMLKKCNKYRSKCSRSPARRK